MAHSTFKPVIYLKAGCPFCLKLRLFLLESDMLHSVQLRGIAAEEEPAIRAELALHMAEIRFPTAQLAAGEYVSDSDAIIADLARRAGIDVDQLPTYTAYVQGSLRTRLDNAAILPP